jgi:tetratricopeptide (TPR) repeat protein
LGGIGKTTLAIEFAYQFQSQYSFIAFLDAGTPHVLDSSLLGLAEHLTLQGSTNSEKLIQLQHWLANQPGWLLICDNVDDEFAREAVTNFIPSICQGYVLITTRDARPTTVEFKVKLPDFSPDEAVEFLFKRTSSDREATSIKFAELVAKELGYLPLALEQAGALIHVKQWTYERYLKKYKEHSLDLLKQGAAYANLSTMEKKLKQVAVTWSMNLEEIQAKDTRFKEFLNLIAFMAPERIPFEWIYQGLAKTEFEIYSSLMDSDEVSDFLVDLNIYSLLHVEKNGFQLHRLVQEVIRYPLEPKEKEHYHLCCIKALIETAPNINEFHNWSKLYYIHAQFLTESTLNHQQEKTAILSNLAGYYAHNILSDMNAAEIHYQNDLRIQESLFDITHSTTLRAYNNLGCFYRDIGKVQQGKMLLQKVLSIREAQGNDVEPIALANSYNNLALVFQIERDYKQAKKLFKKSLKIRQAEYGKSHPVTAKIYNNIGCLYQEFGRYKQAKPYLQKVLQIYEAHFSENHPDTIYACNNLGAIYLQLGKLEEAKPLLLRAMDFRQKLFGGRHHLTLTTYNNLGMLYKNQGNYKQAEFFLGKVFITLQDKFGPKHPDTQNALQQWTGVYLAQGMSNEQAGIQMQGQLQTISIAH